MATIIIKFKFKKITYVCDLIKKKFIKKLMNRNLSIIIPVFNEKSLSLMIKILNSTLEFDNEIIIVYDNEQDNSIPVAKKMQKI